MDKQVDARGRHEISAALRGSRGLILAVGLFSAFANLLLLTGPLFMLQVYDRVLGSQSEETLVALIALVAFLYAVMGILDFVRGRVMARVSARVQEQLGRRVFDAVTRKSALGLEDEHSRMGLRNLDAVAQIYASPVWLAFFDLPFTPVFLFGIMLFHPWMGALALGGGLLLVLVTVLNQISTQALARESQGRQAVAGKLSEHIRDESEMVRSLGMESALRGRWGVAREAALQAQVHHSDIAGRYSILVKTLRLFLQSAMLALGAWLVLRGEVTSGAMIASSILMGRALAPVEQIIGQWPAVQSARRARQGLALLLGSVGVEPPRTALPRPEARLSVENVAVVPPGSKHVTLRGVTFRAGAGQAVGVIGPSGAGKSSLAKALTGLWPLAQGDIRLDGAAISQFDSESLGRHVGYLPQNVRLFEGTIAENIARMTPNPDAEAVVAAARQAAAHEMILQLPKGYDTPVGNAHSRLSGGELQRVGLARALFGAPVVLILDEPNSNLDNQGTQALNEAIRQMKARGGIVLIMAHRPAAIQECDLLLMIEGGQMRAFGPKDEVMAKVVANRAAVAAPGIGGGVS